MGKYVIIGGVAAGMSAAARLRRLDEQGEIVVFERGEYISYANCGLPYYIGDTIHERETLLVQTPEAFRQRFRVDIRTRSEVMAIAPEKGSVRVRDLATGREYDESYGKLLLAPGGSPVRPPIPGIDNPRIHTLWTIPDTDRIREIVDSGVKSALVVGAGFIGLEMVENLRARGINVTVVEAARQALNVLDFEMAALVHRELRRQGIDFRFGETVTALGENPAGSIVASLASGVNVTADLVLLSVGVAPNTGFLSGSGIELVPRHHIVVDEYLRTAKENIFAAGDAVEVVAQPTATRAAIPLAGPANKQGRIAAENMTGRLQRKYGGTLGTAIAKVFDLAVGMTGATEKSCAAAGMPCGSVIVHPNAHAGYYPAASPVSLKLVFCPQTRRVLGAQAVGRSGVDKRIDVVATAIRGNMTVDDLAEFEHAYAPPYSSAKDPVNMAGFAAQNILDGLVSVCSWMEAAGFNPEDFLLDVRTPAEYAGGTIPGAVNVPVDELRERLGDIPRDRRVTAFCQVGLRGYLAARILAENGYGNCRNLSGGYLTWQTATAGA